MFPIEGGTAPWGHGASIAGDSNAKMGVWVEVVTQKWVVGDDSVAATDATLEAE